MHTSFPICPAEHPNPQWEEMRHDTSCRSANLHTQSSRSPSTGELTRSPVRPLARAPPGHPQLASTPANCPQRGRREKRLPREAETTRHPPPKRVHPRAARVHPADTDNMDKVLTCIFIAIGVVMSARAQVYKGKS